MFVQQRKPPIKPLDERMRPLDFDAFIGQEDLTAENLPLRRSVSNGNIPSIILWGPPGSGKTTLARLIASKLDTELVF